MAANANHERELQLRMPYAVVAGVGGIALLGALVIQAVGPQPKVQELTLELLVINQRGGLEITGALVNAIGLIGLGLTLAFLGRAARDRKPEMSKAMRLTAI